MKVELPKLKRCCFCIPLRYGLITCGYLRLVLLLVICTAVTYVFATHPSSLTTSVILIKSTFLLLLVVDSCLTVVFLVGGHRKTTKQFDIYYIYNVVLLCVFALFFTWATINDLCNKENLSNLFGYSNFLNIIHFDILMGVVSVGIQFYIIILIRSEADKLKNNANCRFDNIAAEAQCTLIGP